jgi:hypothetical protein
VRTCRRPRPTPFRCRCGTTSGSDQIIAHLEHIARWDRRCGCPPWPLCCSPPIHTVPRESHEYQ